MRRIQKLIVGGWIVGVALVAIPGWSLDKDHLADHLRKALSIDPRQTIEIGETEKSEVGNLRTVDVKIDGNAYPVFYSKKETHYIWGNAFDLRVDPDQDRESKISLQKVISTGAVNAPIVIVEYTDLQCPFCKKAHSALEADLYEEYDPSQVRWVFKHFPLSMHKWAEPAAVATECAARQEKGWEMADLFFENTKSIKPKNVEEKSVGFAKKLKLDAEKFKACLSDPDALAAVEADKKEGLDVGVTSTPTLFINGRMRRGFRRFEDVSVIIDEKLEAAEKK